MGIEVLGPIAVDGDTAFLARRERIVLGVLVVSRDRVVGAETLADALWPQGPPATWTKVVQGCVVRLRKLLGTAAIATSDLGYRLAVPGDDIDAHRFERLLDRARELLDIGEPDRAAYLADEALALWRGAPLPELEAWEQGRIEAVRLTDLHLDAQDLRLDAAVRAGRHRQVLAEARAMVAQAPLRERRWELLALAQYQSGQQAEALRTLRQARQVMLTELGLDPGPALVAMEEAILRQEPGLLSDELPDAVPECPYLGLVPYDVDDAEEFFGREREVTDCLRRLADTGVLVVVGPSGSGKSSLVRAGVAAALQRDGERVVLVAPGAHPMEALSALPDGGRPPVLLVDQAEEAVALAQDDAERAAFFAALAGHAERAPLIVAMRADRLGALTAYPEFARLVERGLYLLKVMDNDQLRAAIEAPARQAGLLLEPGLVDLLVRDVEGEPGSLPLLSHALRQTWMEREGGTLTVEGYQASGGIRGAVAQSAETVYDRASEPEQRMLRELFLRLVTPSPDGAPVRSRLHREVVAPDDERAAVIETLVQARLVTSDEDVVEIAHEALARAWPRLRGWLDDDVEGHRVWRHLAASAQAWQSMERPESELYRGVRLARAVEWRERSGTDLTTVEREFLTASETAHRTEIDRAEAEARQAAAEAARQGRLNRRLKLLVGVVGVLTVLAATAGAIAMRQAGRADLEASQAQREAERADAGARLARSHELAASSIATMSEDAGLARLLAVAAADAAPPNLQSTAALHRAWAADATVSRRSMAFNAVGWPDLHPRRDHLLLAGLNVIDIGRQVEVLDVSSGERVWTYDLPNRPGFENAFLTRAQFADGGDTVVVGAHWQPESQFRVGGPVDPAADPPAGLLGAYVLNARTGEEIERIEVGRCGGIVVGVTDRYLLVRVMVARPADGSDGADLDRRCDWRGAPGWGLDLVDRRDGSRRRLTTHSGALDVGFAMSADGRIAAYDDRVSRNVIALDLASGREVMRVPRDHHDLASVEGPDHRVHQPAAEGGRTLVLAVSDDGSRVMLGVNPVQVWDVATASLVSTFDGHGGTASFGRFTADGATAYTTGNDGALREWSVSTGREVRSFPGTANGPVAMGAGGLVAAGQYNGRHITVLDTGVRAEVAALETCRGTSGQHTPMGMLRGGPHGIVLGTVCRRDTVTQTWLPGGGVFDRVLPGAMDSALDVSPDGRLFVRQDGSGGTSTTPYSADGLTVRNVRTGDVVTRLEGVCTYRVTAEGDDTRGCADFPKRPFRLAPWRVRWSPDGAMIAAIEGDGLVVWDAETGKITFADALDAGLYDGVFSPSSDELVVSTEDGEIRRLSTSTWDVLHSFYPDLALHFAIGMVGYTPDGSSLIVVTGEGLQVTGSMIGWLDVETLALERQRTLIHDGSVGSAALHPDGTRLATAGTDGLARVWDVGTGEMRHEVDLGDDTPLHGVAWVDEQHLALAPRDGGLLVVTTDPTELLRIVRASLARGFTGAECDRFGFGADCPDLGELRGGTPSAEAAALAGTYTLSWAEDEVEAVFRAGFEEIIGSELDEASTAEIDFLRDTYAGDYTWTFDGAGYLIERDGDSEPVCIGSYEVRKGRLILGGERGDFCQFTQDLLTAEYTLDEGRLQIRADGFRGFVEDRIAWTTKPLIREQTG